EVQNINRNHTRKVKHVQKWIGDDIHDFKYLCTRVPQSRRRTTAVNMNGSMNAMLRGTFFEHGLPIGNGRSATR
ncbi:hypothetical protein AVEN_119495-1, partial [Araneus ventricosus]